MSKEEKGGRITLDGSAASLASDRQSQYTPAEQLARGRYRITDASESVYFARLWIEANPDAWAYIVKRALTDARAKRRVSIAQLVEDVRRIDFVNHNGQPFKINNRLRPGLARILARDYPEIASYIEMRKAACDGMV